MGLYQSISGTVRVRLTGADLHSTIKAINAMDIKIYHLETEGELNTVFSLRRRDFRKAKKLAEKKGDRIEEVERVGIFWFYRSCLTRPVLMIGILIIFLMTILVPQRILFVSVEGSTRIPPRMILEAAGESGVHFWCRRREIRSEVSKNVLLAQIPELQWAGINTYGCRAVITVRERKLQERQIASAGISSIVAGCDGIIISCTATKGTVSCKVGQAVSKGEILVSGYVDSGRILSGTDAEGEIYAATRHQLTALAPAKCVYRHDTTQQTTKFSLVIGKKRINFYNGSGIFDTSCVKMYSKYVLTLPGGFSLPVAVLKETVMEGTLAEGTVPEHHLSGQLSQFAQDYLKDQMVAGTVDHSSESFQALSDCYRLNGWYDCTEMIGRRQREMIGEIHGKDN